ncbi:MAG: tetratricopeptide repeat protein [Burkholderiales bacterium]
MRMHRLRGWALAAALLSGAAHAAPLTHAQALAALNRAETASRLAGVDRLAQIGSMADAARLLDRLRDSDAQVRELASLALWRIWSRSGDPAIDRLFASGLEQMGAAAFDEALATFDEVVRRKPAFAEGWNKRATLYFMLGQLQKSLLDCDEVLKRNPHHFGALSGAGQIHLQLGNLRSALEYFRRAVDANPNLEGPAQMIPLLEERLRDDPNRT